MTNEELILERLDRIETQLAPISQTANGIRELRDDLTPLSGQAVRVMIRELEDVEASFQLEDLMVLVKRMLRSVKDIIFAMEQLEKIVDFVKTIEPLLKSAVPQIINYLDELEQKGVLRVINATLDIRAKIAEAYTAEDIEEIGDGVVTLLGLAKKLSDKKSTDFLNKLSNLPSQVDFEGAKPVGPFGMLGALSTKEARQGLGVLMSLTKAMGRLNNGGGMATAESSDTIA